MSLLKITEISLARFQGVNVLKGREDDVKYLIYYNLNNEEGEAVIFVDTELDLDWELSGKLSEIVDQEPFRKPFTAIVGKIAALEPIAHNWPCDLKLTSKRLLGEALASILRKDIEGANAAIDHAQQYIKAKSRQVSRYWTLKACLIAGSLSAVAGVLDVLARDLITERIGPTAFLLSLCFWSGCIGALLFVVLRLGGTQKVDSTAEKHLHYLEAVARIVGGGIAGILVGGMVKLGLFLSLFGQTGKETLAMCTAAMIAGASERLAAGIVTKVENHEISKEENADADY